MSNPILSFAARFFFERPVKNMALAQIALRVEQSGNELAQRAAGAPDTPANRETLRHITGIERWGQRRLRVLLGEPLVMDEYDGYRPEAGLDWSGMQAAYQSARRDTVALARELEKAGVSADRRVAHNTYGQLTARGWLEYLRMHANLESRKIR